MTIAHANGIRRVRACVILAFERCTPYDSSSSWSV